MTVYLDLLLFENFIFNLFIFYVSFKMLNFKLSIRKLIFSSIISSLVCVLIFIKFDSILYLFFITVVSFFTNLYFHIPKFTFRYVFQVLITVMFISFMLFGIISFLNVNLNKVNYLFVLIIFLIVFVIFDITKKYIKKNAFFNNYIFNVTLEYRNKIYKFKGFLDTGNELREPITGLPVIIVETRCMPGIFYNEKYFYKIPYKVITGDTSYFEGTKVKNVCFKSDSHEFFTDVILCTTQVTLDSENRFEAILSRCII